MTRIREVLRWLADWLAGRSPALRSVADESAPQSLADLNARSTRAHLEGR